VHSARSPPKGVPRTYGLHTTKEKVGGAHPTKLSSKSNLHIRCPANGGFCSEPSVAGPILYLLSYLPTSELYLGFGVGI